MIKLLRSDENRQRNNRPKVPTNRNSNISNVAMAMAAATVIAIDTAIVVAAAMAVVMAISNDRGNGHK